MVSEDEEIKEKLEKKIKIIRQIHNSDIIKHVIFSLVKVATVKTSEDYAWSIVKNLLRDLESDFDFLKFVYIDDLENLENNTDDIVVITDVDEIDPKKIGNAIQKIIDIFKEKMGSKAGFFFLREFEKILGEEYTNEIKKIGVDLRLIDLQKQIYGMGDSQYKIKNTSDSNIAFIEKQN